MKLYKKIFLALFICLLFVQSSYAINEKKEKNKKENEIQNTSVEYNNEVHSVFSLKDCINIAVEHNPSIRSSIYTEQIYQSKIGQAWSNFFPKISGGLDLSRTMNHYSGDVSYQNSSYTLGYVPSISAGMMLFDFGKTKAQADYAKRTFESKQATTKENINDIVYNIKSAYFNILFA